MSAIAYSLADPPSLHWQSTGASEVSSLLQDMLFGATQHARDNANDWRSLTKALIEQLAVECQLPDWDGYGAEAVSEESKCRAQYVVDLLPYRLPPPEPVPDSEGEIALSWDFGRGRVFTVSVGADGVLNYAGLLGGGVKRYGAEPFKGDVPKAILESVEQLWSNVRAAEVRGR
jgi:hypothetical protein